MRKGRACLPQPSPDPHVEFGEGPAVERAWQQGAEPLPHVGDSCHEHLLQFDLMQLEHDPEEELAVLDQLIEWQRQTGEYGDAAK